MAYGPTPRAPAPRPGAGAAEYSICTARLRPEPLRVIPQTECESHTAHTHKIL